MNKWIESGDTHRKNRHGFSGPRDGVAPPGSEQMQNGRNQRSGMGDTDPEDKVNQIGSPPDRVVLATRTDTDNDLVDPAGSPNQRSDQ